MSKDVKSVRIPIGKLWNGGVCTTVPEQLWAFVGPSKGYNLVFSDTKPEHATGVYRFRQSPYDSEGIAITGAPRSMPRGDAKNIYITADVLAQLWGSISTKEPQDIHVRGEWVLPRREAPLSGYVWAEEK